jgi:hypothetical protein
MYTKFTVFIRNVSYELGGGPEVVTICKTPQEGLPEGWTRATFILRKDYLNKLKALAYWKRKKIKEVIDEALASYLEGKKIKPLTKR